MFKSAFSTIKAMLICLQTVYRLWLGTFEKSATLEISKNSLYRVIFSTFLDILCISMHFRAIKSSILTKMGEFLLNHPNFQKISAPAAPKIGHFSPFFQFFGAEKLVTLGQNWAPFWPLAPPNSSPVSNSIVRILTSDTI